MNKFKKQIYFIVGPTSSGKTAMSIELAKKLGNCEIISADSRQIFKDFDLASGKVTDAEMKNVPHHLLSIIEPEQYFSVIDFANLALQTIEKIYERGNTPIICGGTGFYIDALLYNYNLPTIPNNEDLRLELSGKSVDELFEILKIKDREYFDKHNNLEYKNNKHRIIRAIEIATYLGKIPELKKTFRFSPDKYEIRFLQPEITREKLREKIYTRILTRLEQGMIEEVVVAKEKYCLSFEYLKSLGLEFKWIAKFLQNEVTKEEMIRGLYVETCQYAKRQDTWLKRYSDFTFTK